MNLDPASRDRLIADAAALYRPAGRFAYHFARGKLRGDPLFTTLLRLGAIPNAGRLVDLGCGQGLLGAWLAVARRGGVDSTAPRVDAYCGVDQSKSDVARARIALPGARIVEADLRSFDVQALAPCDVITLFDVLHYLEPAAQQRLLFSAHAALRDAGTLVLRVGDAAPLSASRWANAVDLFVCALRGHPRAHLYRRSIHEWSTLLLDIGFDIEILDDERVDASRRRKRMSFANVLLRATKKFVVPAKAGTRRLERITTTTLDTRVRGGDVCPTALR